MGIKKVKWICPSCNFPNNSDEITSKINEEFINCDRCGFFKQKMLKSAIQDINKIKEKYPNYEEVDDFISIKSGGYGVWKIVQETTTHEGSFIDKKHISHFIETFDELFSVKDVVEIYYTIKDNDGNWMVNYKTKKVDK